MNIELLMKLEKQFKCNENFGDTGLSTFEFQKGDLPIIITAPHSVKTRKVTKDGMDVIKENEVFTGAFALYLNQSFGVHAMVRNNYPYNTFIDPKKEIRDLIEYIRKNNIKYLVDIHGAHRKRSFDIAPGTSHGRFIEHDERYKNIIISSFQQAGILNVDFDTIFQASSEKTISRIIFDENKIKTTQLEINKNYRDINLLSNLRDMLVGLDNYTKNLIELTKEDYPKVYRK